jgi:hypothetical protein
MGEGEKYHDSAPLYDEGASTTCEKDNSCRWKEKSTAGTFGLLEGVENTQYELRQVGIGQRVTSFRYEWRDILAIKERRVCAYYDRRDPLSKEEEDGMSWEGARVCTAGKSVQNFLWMERYPGYGGKGKKHLVNGEVGRSCVN